MLTRRTVLGAGLLAGGGALLHARRGGTESLQADDVVLPPSPPVTPFLKRLPIPRLHAPLNGPAATDAARAKAQAIYQQALAEGRFKHAPVAPDGPADYYEVTARPGTVSLIPGLETAIWGYNGQYPGPTFLARRNRPVVVRLLNRIPEIISMHYHGAHTPPDSDGTPMLSFSGMDRFAPGAPRGSRTYVYPNDNDFPATLWYHDHALDVTGPNVYSGLAGFFLLTPGDGLEDEPFREVDAALPSGYGTYDIPMMFQDRRFYPDGSLLFDTFEHDGFLGDHFLVNGAIQPFLPVARRKYRFRFLNGSNARFYELALSGGGTFTQIGTDGALLPHPVERSRIPIAPAERYEVVIDFSRYPLGSKVYLQNVLLQDNGSKPGDVDLSAATPLVQFRVNRNETDPSAVPYDLNPGAGAYISRYLDPANPLVPGLPLPVRTLALERNNGAWQINLQPFDRDRVDVYERLNTQSIWQLSNMSGGWVHPIHIHDMEFRLLDRNGRPPHPGEAGLKDVFVVGRNETIRVMACWTGGNNVGRYVFHCHNLEHEDMSMMGVFEVVP